MGCTASTATGGGRKKTAQKTIEKEVSSTDLSVEANSYERAKSFNSMNDTSASIDTIHASSPGKRTHDAYVRRLDKLLKEIEATPAALVCEVSIRRQEA